MFAKLLNGTGEEVEDRNTDTTVTRSRDFPSVFPFSFLHWSAYLNSRSQWFLSPTSCHRFHMLNRPESLWQVPTVCDSTRWLEPQILTACPDNVRQPTTSLVWRLLHTIYLPSFKYVWNPEAEAALCGFSKQLYDCFLVLKIYRMWKRTSNRT